MRPKSPIRKSGAKRRPGAPSPIPVKAKRPVAAPPKPAAPLRQWKVKIVGLVSRPQGTARIAAPHGDYLMKETGFGTYLLAREGGPKFALTTAEVGGHVEGHAIRIVEGGWP